VETIGSKRSYALIWCMPNNDDDDVYFKIVIYSTVTVVMYTAKLELKKET